ncbi:MAG: response regulator transcription factor [Actinomycetota bacterium]|jgi:DNA-binding NarL/FixJ family response regulator|nr:response regulator transcription factor [Actinomycetota bacterium]
MVKVFLLDDHEVVRAGLRQLLGDAADDIEVVGEAAAGEAAMAAIEALAPDVAVLDVRLEGGRGMDGVEVCRQIRARRPEVACLMFTSFSDDEALLSAVMAGASGFLLKNANGGELAEAIRQLAAGGSLLDPGLTRRLLERIREGSAGDPLQRLTDQERRVLDFLVEAKTNRQIATELHLAEKTVKNYVSSVLAKLGMRRRTEAAVFAARLGAREGERPG